MRMPWLLAAILAMPCLDAAAQDKPCSKADAARAEKAVERVNTWPQMRKAWQDLRQCDSGPVSDAFTETFVRLLVQWKEVDAMAASMNDAAFKAFMEKHLKDPAARDDLDSIYSRTKSSCPATQEAFCTQLGDFVKSVGK
jgi:hypothetical protein